MTTRAPRQRRYDPLLPINVNAWLYSERRGLLVVSVAVDGRINTVNVPWSEVRRALTCAPPPRTSRKKGK